MIPIIDNLYLKSNGEEYILIEKKECVTKEDNKTRKKGEKYIDEVNKGYYMKVSNLLSQALQMTLKRKIEANKIKTLEDLLKQTKELEKYMEGVLLQFNAVIG